MGTCDTMTRVRGIARVCELSYRTRTHQTRDLKPAGFPVPVTNPIYNPTTGKAEYSAVPKAKTTIKDCTS